MTEFRIKIGENGRIVIPVACRQQLHFTVGMELILKIDQDELRLFSLNHSLKKAQALVKSYAKGQSLVKKLKIMRKEDSSHE